VWGLLLHAAAGGRFERLLPLSGRRFAAFCGVLSEVFLLRLQVDGLGHGVPGRDVGVVDFLEFRWRGAHQHAEAFFRIIQHWVISSWEPARGAIDAT